VAYFRFIRLCWQAYNGDLAAGLEVISILKSRFGGALK